MAYLEIITGLDDSTVAYIHSLFDELEALTQYRIKLTPPQRSALPVVGDRRFSFLSKNIRYAKRHGDLMPPFRSLLSYQRVYFDFTSLQGILDRARTFTEGLRDTTMQAGANAYEHGLTFYEMIGKASETGMPGTEVIYKDLRKHFERIVPSEEIEPGTESKDQNGGANPNPIPGVDPKDDNAPA